MRGLSARAILITDPRYAPAHVDATVVTAARATRDLLAVQLRDKGASHAEFRARAIALRALTAAHGAWFIVNGDPDLAAEVDADAVHLPGFAERDGLIARARAIVGPSRAIHVPVHTDEELAIACARGADALLVSPIFESPGKGPARGLAALERARAHIGRAAFEVARAEPRSSERCSPHVRIYALGGVEVVHAPACRKAGADGVAIIRALLDAADPASAAKGLVAPWLNAS